MQLSPVPSHHPAPRLIYTTSPIVHRGFFHTSCWVQKDHAPDYPVVDKFDAITDDFGNLHRLTATNGHGYATSTLYAHNADTHFDIDDAAHALIWPDHLAPEASKPPPAVEINIQSDTQWDWIAAEICVTAAAPDISGRLYRLCIGREDPIYATQHELQGLASACADLLGLQLRAKPASYRRAKPAKVTARAAA